MRSPKRHLVVAVAVNQKVSRFLLGFPGLEAGLDVLAALYNSRSAPDPERSLVLPGAHGETVMRDEAAAKALLREAGLDIPFGAEADGVDEACRAADGHYPVGKLNRSLTAASLSYSV